MDLQTVRCVKIFLAPKLPLRWPNNLIATLIGHAGVGLGGKGSCPWGSSKAFLPLTVQACQNLPPCLPALKGGWAESPTPLPLPTALPLLLALEASASDFSVGDIFLPLIPATCKTK